MKEETIFTSLLMHRCMASNAPFYLPFYFNYEYSPRGSMYYLEVVMANHKRQCITYMGTITWNRLDDSTKY